MTEEKNNNLIDFSDIVCLSQDDVVNICENEIILYNGQKINLDECVKNYNEINKTAGNFIGERDDKTYTVTFYTSPYPTEIHFVKKGRLKEMLSKKTTPQKYFEFTRKLHKSGYNATDLQ